MFIYVLIFFHFELYLARCCKETKCRTHSFCFFALCLWKQFLQFPPTARMTFFFFISATQWCQHHVKIMFSAYMNKMSHHPAGGPRPPIIQVNSTHLRSSSASSGAEDEAVDSCSVVRQPDENRHNKHTDATRREAGTASACPICKLRSIRARHKPAASL